MIIREEGVARLVDALEALDAAMESRMIIREEDTVEDSTLTPAEKPQWSPG